MYYALGYEEGDFKKPMIGVAKVPKTCSQRWRVQIASTPLPSGVTAPRPVTTILCDGSMNTFLGTPKARDVNDEAANWSPLSG